MDTQGTTIRSSSKDNVPLEALHVERVDDEESPKVAPGLIIAQHTAFAGFSRLDAIKSFWWPSLICLISTIGCLNDGYQNQLPGSLVSNQGFINKFGKVRSADGSLSIAASWVSIWGAMMPVGQIPSTLVSGSINDRFGRKGAMYLFTTLYLAGTVAEMTAKTPGQWAAAKFIFGLAQGITTSTIPVYIGEIAPPPIRGTLLCLYGFLFAIGQVIASVVLYAIELKVPLDWRLAVYTEWAFHGFWIFLGLIWLPESPWYYARRGKRDKALDSLNRIYKGVPSFDAAHELGVIEHELEQEQEVSTVGGWKALFKGTDRIRTFGAALAISTQILCGTIVIFTYTAYFVQEAGIGEPFLASMIVYIVLLVGLFTSFFAVELLGRRTLIIGGGIFCTTCNLIIGITGCLQQTSTVKHAALAFIFLWVFSYANSFASVAWAMVSEGASARLKAKTASFSMWSYNIFYLVLTVSVPYMIGTAGAGARDWGTKTLFMFAITTGVATVGNFFICPETKGRTQSELDEMYEEKIKPRKFSQYVTELQNARKLV